MTSTRYAPPGRRSNVAACPIHRTASSGSTSRLHTVSGLAAIAISRCEECLKTGGWWVHLRMCQICGKIGCCDNSPSKHATAHFHETSHPIIRSAEPGEDWSWCYVDEIGLELD